jgi:hypothetical protein
MSLRYPDGGQSEKIEAWLNDPDALKPPAITIPVPAGVIEPPQMSVLERMIRDHTKKA